MIPTSDSTSSFCIIKSLIILLLFPYLVLFSREGLQYQHIVIPNSSLFRFITPNQSIHVINVDPSLFEIKLVKALDDGLGRESVLSLSARYGALASINGGFFTMGGTFDGQACGALKIHDWFAIPAKSRGAIGWSKNQEPLMDRLFVDMNLDYENHKIIVDGLNCPRKEREMVVYTPCFHKTTLTDPHGEEIEVVRGVIEKITPGGSSKIHEEGCILSIHEKHPLYGTFEKGKSLSLSPTFQVFFNPSLLPLWEALDYILGGGPLLIHKGKKIDDFTPEEMMRSFLSFKRARTALGILPNGDWVFVVVDKTGLFDGMTIMELREFMAKMDCVYALNLDGGGSSTMVYEGRVKNTNFGDEDAFNDTKNLRHVSDAIVILPKDR